MTSILAKWATAAGNPPGKRGEEGKIRLRYMDGTPGLSAHPEAPSPANGITVEHVEQQLRRILASQVFADSSRSHQLLEYCIHMLVHGRSSELQEHRLATALRTEKVTPGEMPRYSVLRAVARRTRARLDRFYRTEGIHDPLVMELPRSSYIPHIQNKVTGERFIEPQPHPVLPTAVPLGPPAVRSPLTAPEPILEEPDTAIAEGDAAEALVEGGSEPGETGAPVENRVDRMRAALAAKTGKQPPVVNGDREEENLALEEESEKEHRPEPIGLRRAQHEERHHSWPLPAAIGALCLAAGVAVGIWNPFQTGRPKDALPTFGTFRKLTIAKGVNVDPAAPSDGHVIVYASDRGTKGNLNLWVQSVLGGAPTRLTTSDFDDHHPSITQDGSTIVFRSERGGGGVFKVGANGGSVTKLVDFGRHPRISPDGRWVAYWSFAITAGARDSQVSIVPLNGGDSKTLSGNFLTAQLPIWSPDSRYVMFLGIPRPDPGKRAEEREWWVVDIDSGKAVKTGIIAAPRRVEMVLGPASMWLKDNRILFEALTGESKNIWAVSLDRGFHPTGRLERVTIGLGNESQPLLTELGRLVVSGVNELPQIWSLPLESNQGKAGDDPRPVSITQGVMEYAPSISHDGSRVAFVSERSGEAFAMLRTLSSGAERALGDGVRSWSPVFSPDGNHIGLLQADLGNRLVFATLISGENKSIGRCDGCERIFSVSNDGNRVLYGARRSSGDPLYAGVWDKRNNLHTTVIGYPRIIFSADWSPDGRWIAYSERTENGRLRIRVLPSTGLGAGSDFTKPDYLSDKPRWSPDGRLVYYLSDEDSFRCLYARRVSPSSGEPDGAAWVVHHFHEARHTLLGIPTNRLELSIGRDRAVFTVQDVWSAIWTADSQQ